MPIIPSQRRLFDVPDDIAYFNCAYNSPQLNESKHRLLAGACAKGHPWERTQASFCGDAEQIRSLSADIFGGDADGYAVVPAASYGLSTAARAWGFDCQAKRNAVRICSARNCRGRTREIWLPS